MYEFTHHWVGGSPHAATNPIEAGPGSIWAGARDAVLVPLILVVAFLFVLGVMTGWHLRDHDERAQLYTAYAIMGMPMLHSLPTSCRAAPGNASATQLRHADLISLLAKP